MKFIQDGTLRNDIPDAFASDSGFLGVLVERMGEQGLFAMILTTPWLIALINFLWSTYVFLAYLASIIMLALYVYASVRWNQYLRMLDKDLRDQEKLYDEHYRGSKRNSRLDDVYAHIDSDNPNDWKLAIIEADVMLDDLLKQRGYAGNSLGERLRSISPAQLQSLDDAWEAHKVRNHIAHGGADFVLTKRLAEETINRYRRVFTEFGL